MSHHKAVANENDTWDLGKFLTSAIQEGFKSGVSGSPEDEYLGNLKQVKEKSAAEFVNAELTAYIDSINQRLKNSKKEAIKEYLELAESHRRKFHPFNETGRTSNPLSERTIALPMANTSQGGVGPKRMNAKGRVTDPEKPQPHKRPYHQRYTQPPYMTVGCPFSDYV